MTTNNLATDRLSDQLQIHTQRQFTGRLDIQAANTWSLYFCHGRLVWATGGLHPLRRWQRNLGQYCPQIPPNGVRLRQSDMSISWEYQVLTILVKRQKIAGDQAVAVIKSTLAEVLFDILQHEGKEPFTFIGDQQDVLDASLTLINPAQALQEAQQAWESWQKAGLANLSPNLAPVLKQPEELQKLASPRVYQTLVKVVNGKRTLRDLAIQVKQELGVLTRSLLPYIRKQVIGLVKISDLPSPFTSPAAPPQESRGAEEQRSRGAEEQRSRGAEEQRSRGAEEQREISQAPITSPQSPITSPQAPISSPPSPISNSQLERPLVVYVEDSLQDRQIMEEILTKARYGFVSIEDSMQALPLLLQYKPDVILLDLVMPVANGYEICAQIRRISIFKNTPVIILTGNDGIVDRVRAKMVGATDFLAKPIAAQKVLSTLMKYLNSHTLPQSTTQSFHYQAS